MRSKILLSLVLSLSLICSSFAQSITNGSFENWNEKFYYEDPAPYVTTNVSVYAAIDSGNVKKSTDSHGGIYSAKLQTITTGTDTMFGAMFIGTPATGTIKGGTPLVTRPDSIKIYAKHDIKTNDTAFVAVLFKKAGNIIGWSEIKIVGLQKTYTEYKSVVTWFVPFISTDTVSVVLTSSCLDGKKMPGSFIYYDDLTFTSSTQFPYGNFETWNAVSAFEPDKWNTMNYICPLGNYSATKTADAYDGNWALLLKNVAISVNDTIGYVTNGKFGNNGPQGGMAISQNPNLVTGYYKYIPSGTDTAYAVAFLYRHDAVHDSTITLETEIIKLPPVSSYTQFSIPFIYDSWPYADTLNLTFAAGDYFSHHQKVGSKLYLDKLEIFYVPLKVSESNMNASKINVFPNPGNGIYNLNLNLERSQSVNLELFNENGQNIYSEKMNYSANSTNTLNLSSFAKGVYYLKIISDNNIFNKKIIIQ